MTDAALLPPDPSVPGRYWMRTGKEKPVVGLWYPTARHWRVEGWRTAAGPEDLHYCGYTLASPHPIPGPAALEALHALPDQFKREAREGSEGVQPDYRLIAICTAQADAAMLRAALETKETT